MIDHPKGLKGRVLHTAWAVLTGFVSKFLAVHCRYRCPSFLRGGGRSVSISIIIHKSYSMFSSFIIYTLGGAPNDFH